MANFSNSDHHSSFGRHRQGHDSPLRSVNDGGYLVVFCSFGGIHAAVWKFCFPTVAEMWLWRACSLLQLAVSFVLLLCLAFKRISVSHFCYTRGRWVSSAARSAYDMIQPACGAVYLAAPTIIIVLMFSTLRSSSPDIYKKLNWSSFVPHWGHARQCALWVALSFVTSSLSFEAWMLLKSCCGVCAAFSMLEQVRSMADSNEA